MYVYLTFFLILLCLFAILSGCLVDITWPCDDMIILVCHLVDSDIEDEYPEAF